jgi:WD40 repeat protein
VRALRNLTMILVQSILAIAVFCTQIPLTIAQPQERHGQTKPEPGVRLKAILKGHTKNIQDITFSADGKLIATISDDSTIRLWDPVTGELKAILSGEERSKWEQEQYQQHSAKNDFDPVFVGELKSELDSGARTLSLSPDRRRVLTVTLKPGRIYVRAYVLQLWDLATGQRELNFEELPSYVSKAYWSPDDRSIIVEGERTKARLLDASTGRIKAVLPYRKCTGDSWGLWGDPGCAFFIFSADGSVFLKTKKPLRLWRTQTGQLVTTLKSARLPATFSPSDGVLLVTRGKDKKTALLWEVIRDDQ